MRRRRPKNIRPHAKSIPHAEPIRRIMAAFGVRRVAGENFCRLAVGGADHGAIAVGSRPKYYRVRFRFVLFARMQYSP
jgi:hypothetical protein